jgi:DNA-binding response OmpR family regulator
MAHVPMRDRQRGIMASERGGIVGPRRVLVVDDDPWICRFLTRFLSGEGFQVQSVAAGHSMWRLLKTWPCDLVILDLRLPDGEDGLSLARTLRSESQIALIMLTGKSDGADKIVGLEIGADDYVTKPFEPRELLARIRSVLRRSDHHRADPLMQETGHDVIRFAGWTLDLDQRALTAHTGVVVELTSYEFDLLVALASRPGRPLSREQILELVANRQWAPNDRSVDVLVGKLRRKLNDDPRSPRLIKAIRGIGYVFTCPAAADRADSPHFVS